MSKLLKSIAFLFLIALLGAGLFHLWDNQKHYLEASNEKASISKMGVYTITPIKNDESKFIAPPLLPDISGFTVENEKNKLPALKEGTAVTMDLNKGYRFILARLDELAFMQDKIDPLAIVILDGVYDLDMLTTAINDPTLLQKKDDDTYALFVPLTISAGATLIIQDNKNLLLSASTGGLISNLGNTHIIESTIMGWNTQTNQPALYEAEDKFRPYIVTWCDSVLNIAGSKIANLGYNSSKAYGLTYSQCTNKLEREGADIAVRPAGNIIGSHFSDLYFAFYSYEADDIAIIGNVYEDNIVYGIDPHDRSNNLIIANNEVRRTKEKHGIIISREVNNSFIFNNISEDNNGSGIMIDRNSVNNVIAYNKAQNNKGDGLTFYESSDNLTYKNILSNNENSGLRVRNSMNITSYGDVLNYNENAGVVVYTDNLMEKDSTKHRDLDMDPYEEKVALNLYSTEVIGNVKANFVLTNIDHAQIVAPKLYNSPPHMFLGDLKEMNGKYIDLLAMPDQGIDILKNNQE